MLFTKAVKQTGTIKTRKSIKAWAKIQNVKNEGASVCVYCTAAVRTAAGNCH